VPLEMTRSRDFWTENLRDPKISGKFLNGTIFLLFHCSMEGMAHGPMDLFDSGFQKKFQKYFAAK
jgi:hypothetical protein